MLFYLKKCSIFVAISARAADKKEGEHPLFFCNIKNNHYLCKSGEVKSNQVRAAMPDDGIEIITVFVNFLLSLHRFFLL
jgi:hypothetical protein